MKPCFNFCSMVMMVVSNNKPKRVEVNIISQ